MHLPPLIAIVGLAFSHVHAALPMAGSEDQLIQKVVTLITDPSRMIDTIPGLKEIAHEARRSASLSHAQMHQGAQEIFTSLRDLDNNHSPLILESLVGYHGTQDSRRAEIYRNSMYSRLSDLSMAHPSEFRSHIEVAYDRLLSTLHLQILNIRASHLTPMGSQQALEKLTQFMTEVRKKNQKELREYYHALLSTIPPSPSSQMKYLSIENVNQALLETNANPKLPQALLVNGQFLQSFKKRVHPSVKVPVTQAQTSPTLPTHAAQPVAASA